MPFAESYHSLNQDLAYIIATSYVAISILLSGFFIRISDIRLGFLRGISWCVYMKYSLIGAVRRELLGRTWPEVHPFLQAPEFRVQIANMVLNA